MVAHEVARRREALVDDRREHVAIADDVRAPRAAGSISRHVVDAIGGEEQGDGDLVVDRPTLAAQDLARRSRPIGPSEGSRVACSARKCAASRAACVVVPAPSMPSMTMSLPLIGSLDQPLGDHRAQDLVGAFADA